MADWDRIGGESVSTSLACGKLGVADGGWHESGAMADLPRQAEVCAALVQDHAVGMDTCLIGVKGSGKTSIARRFAASLGYSPRTVYCYADLPARDLLQRRATDEAGSTIWEDSDAVKAAIDGVLTSVKPGSRSSSRSCPSSGLFDATVDGV